MDEELSKKCLNPYACYRILNGDGEVVEGSFQNILNDDQAVSVFTKLCEDRKWESNNSLPNYADQYHPELQAKLGNGICEDMRKDTYNS